MCGAILSGVAAVFFWWAAVGLLLLTVAGVGVARSYSKRLLASYAYTTGKRGITLCYGVFVQKTVLIPAVRLLYCERVTSPLSRKYGLCTLVFLLAKKKVRLPLLTLEQSDQLEGI